MKRLKTSTNAVKPRQKADKFNQVYNDKGRRERGVWLRKGRFYAQLDANNGRQYKYLLEHASTVPQAVTELQSLKKLQHEGKLFPPSFSKKEYIKECTNNSHTIHDAIVEYQTHRAELKEFDDKTDARQDCGLTKFDEKFGHWPLSRLDDSLTKDYAKWRQSKDGGEVSGRTVDLEISAIHHVVDRCVELHWLDKSPLGKWKKLDKGPTRKVRLLEPEDLHTYCKASFIPNEELEIYGQEYRDYLRKAEQAFSDYIYLPAYSGGREKESIQQRWSNVKWGRRVLHFPGARAKKGAGRPAPDRDVDFNKKLEVHLKAMYGRRNVNSDWMFPNEVGDGPKTSFRKQLNRVRKATGMLDLGFHHFRHYFISHCVMAQPWIDYMTIAIWVGHRDKGVLICRVYGHLRPGHSAKMAKHLDEAF